PTEDATRDRLAAISRGGDPSETAAWSPVAPASDATRTLRPVEPPPDTPAPATSAPASRAPRRPRRWVRALLAAAFVLGVAAVAPQSGTDASAALDSFAHNFSSHSGYQELSHGTTRFRGQDVPSRTVKYQSEGADLEASFMAISANGQVYLLWWQTLSSGWDS